jgi:hypothetical protein
MRKRAISFEECGPISDYILSHNGVHPSSYPDSDWYIVPFPASKGYPFNSDNLATVNDYSFVQNIDFQAARSEGESRWVGGSRDISWRLHVFLWAIETAVSNFPELDVVEFGTGQGYMAAASCPRIATRSAFTGRFFLFDTFERNDESLFYYSDDVNEVRSYFSKFPFVQVIEGQLPATVESSGIRQVSFLHVDLNSAEGEEASLRSISPLLADGALVLFDDAGNPGCQNQLEVARNFALSRDRSLLQLPTGQALLLA